MAKRKPVLLSVALSLLLVGCGGTDVSQQQQPVAQQPVAQQPVVQQPDPVAAAKRIAQKFPVGVHSPDVTIFKKEKKTALGIQRVRDYWIKYAYVTEESTKYDVRKTESLVSPLEAIIEVNFSHCKAIGGDLSKQDLYEPNSSGTIDGTEFSSKEKAEAAEEMEPFLEATYRFKFSWQDGKWNLQNEVEFFHGEFDRWRKDTSAKFKLSELKRKGIYKP